MSKRYTKKQITEAIAYWEGALLLEDKHAFERKYGSEPGFKDLFSLYWNAIRHKCKSPENAIEHWQAKPFSEFRDFVQQFDMRSTPERKNAEYQAQAERAGAEMLSPDIDGYEVWLVSSYEAAKILGRFYKGKSAKWCISTDNQKYFKTYFTDHKADFLFLIRQKPVGDDLDKIALELRPDGEVVPWDLADGHKLTGQALATAEKALQVYKECSSKNVRHKEAVSKKGRIGSMEVYVDRLNEVLADAERHGYSHLGYNVSDMLVRCILRWFCEKARDSGMVSQSLYSRLDDLAEELSDSKDAGRWTEWIYADEGFDYDEENRVILPASMPDVGMC